MNVDLQLRALSQSTRDEVAGSLDVEARLDDLRHARRRRRGIAVGAALVAAAAVMGVVVAALPADPVNDLQPVSPGIPGTQDDDCVGHPMVRCLDETTLRVGGANPYTFSVPPGFSTDVNVDAAPHGIDVYQKGVRGGVSIVAGVEPAGGGEAMDAAALAEWVASLDFLDSSRVTRGRLDGMPAWTVEAEWRPGVGRTTETDPGCNRVQHACRPVLVQPEHGWYQSGVWEGMASRYTFLDVPRLGTVAVWSWNFGSDAWESHDALVRTIDFRVS